jgi:hypothetical protein
MRVEAVAWSDQLVPTAVELGFLERILEFSLKLLLNYPHEAECTSFQTQYFSEYLVSQGIEPETCYSVARNSDH